MVMSNQDRQKNILVIDDVPDNFDVITALLAGLDCCFHYASSALTALNRLDVYQPDLILLDVMMAGMDGLEFCRRIRTLPEWQMVPVIMVTALASKADLAACLAAGANDFISKPLDRVELTARVQSMLKVRDQYLQLASFNQRLEQEVAKRTQELQTIIRQDSLTRLPSRTGLLETMSDRWLATSQTMSLIYLDCDDFKLINTTFGHETGNQLLMAIAQRLEPLLRPQDMLARLGEDEFCCWLPDTDAGGAEAMTQTLLAAFERPFILPNCEIFMTVCAGIAVSDTLTTNAETLLQNADTAMYQAKQQGRSHHRQFDQDLQQQIAQQLTLENDIKRALERQEFVTYYQPIINLDSHQVVGLEALVRWQHPTKGMISPGEFIPCLELTGLVIPVGLVVLRQACTQLRQWQEMGHTDLIMSVNLSGRQFNSPTLLTDIDQVIAETQIDPAHLKLEITESAIIENADAAIAITEALRSRNIQISLDDFGTGYSSLGYLHRLPINTLKIDRSFVSSASDLQRAISMVETIMALSRKLQLSVIAEGIETPEQVQWLKQCRCQFGQGYYFSKPLSAALITQNFFASADTLAK
jgi:diguanylate cyclase (GGDEF)-like protein